VARREVVRLPVAGQMRDHVSYSELRLFEQCEWKWYLVKALGLGADERSLPMEFGSAIHSTLEKAFSPDATPSQEELDLEFRSAYEKNVEGLELQPHEVEERERLRELGPKIVRDALACPDLQGIRPMKNELALMVPIARTDGLDVKFKGFVDFVYAKRLKTKTVIYIADFKTCTWGWPAAKLMDPKVCAQILLYKHFFCKITGANPRDVSAAFILLRKTPREGDSSVSVEKIGAGPKVLQSALDFLQGTITGMHSGEYRKNRESCVRRWVDPVTKEDREARCPFFETTECPSADVPGVSTPR